MARVTKAPEERRQEIIETAARLFQEHGFRNCSVDMIIREMGVAKGTFYYYFKSKEQILGAIVEAASAQIVEQANAVADEPSLGALDKMRLLLSGGQMGDDGARELADMMHLPENRELHEIANIQTVLQLSPVLARIVEQGNREGVFAAERPLETVQFLLTGAQFLLDGGLFDFTPDQIRARRDVARQIIEKSLGAEPGSFGFMTADKSEGN